jgi:hypothetical protein
MISNMFSAAIASGVQVKAEPHTASATTNQKNRSRAMKPLPGTSVIF